MKKLWPFFVSLSKGGVIFAFFLVLVRPYQRKVSFSLEPEDHNLGVIIVPLTDGQVQLTVDIFTSKQTYVMHLRMRDRNSLISYRYTIIHFGKIFQLK